MSNWILMADIIGSSSHAGAELMKDFRNNVDEINEQFSEQILSPLTITLGDEFQGIIADLRSAVHIILKLDELILSSKVDYKLRYVINYGMVDTALNSNKAYEMLGKGLSDARQMLTDIKKGNVEIFFNGFATDKMEKLLLSFQLYRSVYNRWTVNERKIVAAFIDKRDYKRVAAIFDRDPSSMWRKEKSLQIKEYKVACRLIKMLAE